MIAVLHTITTERELTRATRARAAGAGYRARCSCGWRAKHRAPSIEVAVRRARRHVPVDGLGVAQGGLFDA